VLDDRRAGEHAIDIAQQILQQRIFLDRQCEFGAPSPGAVTRWVKLQIRDFQPTGSRDRPTAEERSYAG
jgi:hypothetical protein